MLLDKTQNNHFFYSISQFFKQERAGGIVLFLSVIVALFFANSSLSQFYFSFWRQTVGLVFDGNSIFELDLYHWVNDGLMSIFFFSVGLELKREFIGGELANPRKAILPIVAALGGMIVPATIYILLNPVGDVSMGWGIPMATDIAFSLGVLSLLGRRVPLSLKIFLSAFAIVDDLGAVVVIAFFYTSDISFVNLLVAFCFLGFLFLGNKLGIKNLLFYGILGVFGVWIFFFLSGVHATIAAVLCAFMIPTDSSLKEVDYIARMRTYVDKLKTDASVKYQTVDIRKDTKAVISPLQRLETSLHPFVTFFIMPVFALANAGVVFNIDVNQLFETNIMLGVFLGLLLGKVVGILSMTLLFVKLRIATRPEWMNSKALLGVGLLAAIGFTMSLFVTSLAFTDDIYITQAKIGVFAASLIGGVCGYQLLRKSKFL